MTERRCGERAAAVALALLLGAGTASAQTAAPAPFRFEDTARAAGIEYRNLCGAAPMDKGWLAEIMGAGAGWLDYDGDGNLDLYLVNGSTFDRAAGRGEPNRLYRGDGKGRFTDVTTKSGSGDRGWGYGVTVGDFDNDGDSDLYVTNHGPNVLYRNNGDRTFTDVTKAAGVGHPDWSASAAFFDMEGDGDLDLYVTNYMKGAPDEVPRRDSEAARQESCVYMGLQVFCGPLGQTPLQDVLYRNNGDGSFADVTRQSGLWLEQPRFALGVVAADYNNDGLQDLYVANDSVRNSLWKNLGGGKFKDVGVSSLSALNVDGKPQAGMGTRVGDYDGDGWQDIVVTNFANDLNTLYRNKQGRFFLDESTVAGMGVTDLMLSWGTAFHDFDLDGDLDLFIANGHIYPRIDRQDRGAAYLQPNHVFENADGRFIERSADSGPGFVPRRSFRGAAFADHDNDGDVDILVTALDDELLLLRNDSASAGRHWLQVRVVGTESNRDGVGAKVFVKAGGRQQLRERLGGGSYLSASDPRLHFGLGRAGRAEIVEVRWPSGRIDVLRDVGADQTITVQEGSAARRSGG